MLSQDIIIESELIDPYVNNYPMEPTAITPGGVSEEFVRDLKWAAAIGTTTTIGAGVFGAYMGAKRDTTSAVAFGILGLVLGGLGSAMIAGTVVTARAARRV